MNANALRATRGVEYDTVRNRGDFDDGFPNDYDAAQGGRRGDVAIPTDKGRTNSYPGKRNRRDSRAGRGQKHPKFQDSKRGEITATQSTKSFRPFRKSDEISFSPQKLQRDPIGSH